MMDNTKKLSNLYLKCSHLLIMTDSTMEIYYQICIKI